MEFESFFNKKSDPVLESPFNIIITLNQPIL